MIHSVTKCTCYSEILVKLTPLCSGRYQQPKLKRYCKRGDHLPWGYTGMGSPEMTVHAYAEGAKGAATQEVVQQPPGSRDWEHTHLPLVLIHWSLSDQGIYLPKQPYFHYKMKVQEYPHKSFLAIPPQALKPFISVPSTPSNPNVVWGWVPFKQPLQLMVLSSGRLCGHLAWHYCRCWWGSWGPWREFSKPRGMRGSP